jgi:hypothetical protein
MEGLREQDEVERLVLGVPLLEFRDTRADPLLHGHLRHPRIGFDRQNIDAAVGQLARGNACAGSHVEGPFDTRRDEVVDQLHRVAGTVLVVGACRRTERLRPPSFPMQPPA